MDGEVAKNHDLAHRGTVRPLLACGAVITISTEVRAIASPGDTRAARAARATRAAYATDGRRAAATAFAARAARTARARIRTSCVIAVTATQALKSVACRATVRHERTLAEQIER